LLASRLARAAAEALETEAVIAAHDEETDARDEDAAADEESAALDAARRSDGEVTGIAAVERADGVEVFAAHPANTTSNKNPPNILDRPMW
jgi:hypothetical protein